MYQEPYGYPRPFGKDVDTVFDLPATNEVGLQLAPVIGSTTLSTCHVVHWPEKNGQLPDDLGMHHQTEDINLHKISLYEPE